MATMTNTETMRLAALAAIDPGAAVPTGAFGRPGAFIVAPLDDNRHVIAIGRSVEIVTDKDAYGLCHALMQSVRELEERVMPRRTPPGRVPE